MTEIRHVKINPTMDYFGTPTSLENACLKAEVDGFSLVRIVVHHQYESIAVFEREVENES